MTRVEERREGEIVVEHETVKFSNLGAEAGSWVVTAEKPRFEQVR